MRNNSHLLKLYRADQEDRKKKKLNWKKLSDNDSRRRASVLAMIKSGKIISPADYYYAAVIFQHGMTINDLNRAKTYSNKAAALGYARAKWLYAAATDRLLVATGRKQKFGTQLVQKIVRSKNGRKTKKWVLCPYLKNTTDALRAAFGVPSLRKLKRRAREMN